jgi:hypothetical protein
MRRTNNKTRYQDKVVFVLDANSQNRNTPNTKDTYDYVHNMLEIMLRKNNVSTDTVFMGGSKHDLCMWLSGILEFYTFSTIEVEDNTYSYSKDKDFMLPKNFR